MRRVVSLWLPTWPTDRLRRHSNTAPPADLPLVTRLHNGRRMVIEAADPAAQAVGLRAGMPLAQAQAMVPNLVVMPADPAGDAAALIDMAAWFLRFSPLTRACEPDGIWIDATGCEHLHGGEAAMLAKMARHCRRSGVQMRVAIADTAGSAYALARYGTEAQIVVPPGQHGATIAALPIGALRLDAETIAGLHRLGFDRIAQLAATPRAPLARRFGPSVLQRLDQALGRLREPIDYQLPAVLIQHRVGFLEPQLTADVFSHVIGEMVPAVCRQLEKKGQGARQLDLLFERVDSSLQAIRIGVAKLSRDSLHLTRLLRERVEEIDPGLGIEAMRLVVSLADRLSYAQSLSALASQDHDTADLAMLVDRLSNRFGAERVYRIAAVPSDVPERSVRRVSPMSVSPSPCKNPYPRPIRLLSPPQLVTTLSELPDQAPAAFTWRRKRHRIRRADGPERIYGEWWQCDAELDGVRDYWRVEDDDGQRFWLFRRGDGVDPQTGDMSWFLHGFF